MQNFKIMKLDKQDKHLLDEYNFCAYKSGKFNKTKYVKANCKQKTIYLHRLVVEKMLGRKLKKNEKIDHINRNGTDNRRENLRICTHQENMCNQEKRVIGTSEYKGVSFNKKNNKWHTRIWSKYKSIHLGYFLSEEEAAACYNFAANLIHGKYALLNKL